MQTIYRFYLPLLAVFAGSACGRDLNVYSNGTKSNVAGTEPTASTEESAASDGVTDKDAAADSTKCQTLKFNDKWFFSGQQSGFDEAQAETPTGFRLPKRWEIVRAFDLGEFDDIEATGPYWTSSLTKTKSIWVYDFAEGISLKFFKFQPALALYIKSDFFPCKEQEDEE